MWMFISDLISKIGLKERYEPRSTATGFPKNAPLWHTVRCHFFFFFYIYVSSIVNLIRFSQKHLYCKQTNPQRKMFNYNNNQSNKTSNNLRTKDWLQVDSVCWWGFRKLTDLACGVLLLWLPRPALSYTDLPERKVGSIRQWVTQTV